MNDNELLELEFTASEFDLLCEAALTAGMNIEDWATQALIEAAKRGDE
ncbi:MAG TPA: hypothetical protein VF306_09125 [Pirellulales bacterium]